MEAAKRERLTEGERSWGKTNPTGVHVAGGSGLGAVGCPSPEPGGRPLTAPDLCSSMNVGVEDATSSASIVLRVQPHTTIATLKQQVRSRTEPAGHGEGSWRAPCAGDALGLSLLFSPPQVFQDYGFHPLVQRWIIGQCLCVDERTVSSYGIRRDGDTAFLYLLSAKRAELTRQRYEEDQAQLLLNSIAALGDGAAAGEQRQYNTLPSASPRKGPGAAPVPSAGGQEGQPGSCPNPAQILPRSCPNPP